MIKRSFAVWSFFCLSACGSLPAYQVELVTGTPNEVTVRAGHYANPGPLASDHCAKFSKDARLLKFEGPIYQFQCVPRQ